MRTKILTISTMGLAGLVAGGLMALPMTANAGREGRHAHQHQHGRWHRDAHEYRDEHQHPDRHPQRSRQQPQPRRQGLHQGRSRWSEGRPLQQPDQRPVAAQHPRLITTHHRRPR